MEEFSVGALSALLAPVLPVRAGVEVWEGIVFYSS